MVELHSCAEEKSVMSFPLGALCIKTAVNGDGKLPHAVLFEHYRDENPKEAAESCALRKPFAVGLSVYIWNSEWCDEFAEKLKSLCPETVIFAGGPQMAKYADSYLTGEFPNPVYTFVVVGEAETAVVKSLHRISEGKSVEKVIKDEVPDLNSLGSVFLSGEADRQLEITDGILWELSRGCPFGCAFCFEGRGKKTVRSYPFERIEAELGYLVGRNVKNIFVLDPVFNLNRERAKKIMNLLIEKCPDYMHFTFEVRAELLDDELAKMFSRLNCSLQIGLQSSNEKVLENIGRTFDKQVFASKTALLNRYGAAFGLDIIIGLPGDTLESFKKTVNFAVSLMPSNIDCFVLSLLDGTELANNAKALGLVAQNDGYHTLKHSVTMSEQDIAEACRIRDSLDLFYTKGEAGMWVHCLLEALNITCCNLLELFDRWMSQTGRSEDEDIWILQDDFVTSLLKKTKNAKLIPAMKSFMELHQAICYVTDTGEDAILDLSYGVDELALLDSMSLSEFEKTRRIHKLRLVASLEDGDVVFR